MMLGIQYVGIIILAISFCLVFLTISMLRCLDIACQQGCEGLGNMFLPHATAAKHFFTGAQSNCNYVTYG
jgi:NAD-dependent oxidoreductase involved in siderophore biosynthesis